MSSEEKKNESQANTAQDTSGDVDRTLLEFERLVADLAQPTYLFRLYISGSTPRSAVAITNVRRICDQYIRGRYELEVIDVYQQPAQTREAQIVAVPTLIKELPFPPQRFVGDMSNTERIVIGLKFGE